MSRPPRALTPPLCLLLLASSLAAGPAGADQARRHHWVGRRLVDVLQELQQEGVTLLYSSDLVHPDMVVESEPSATSLHEVLEQLLGPHGLRPQIGPQGRVLVVRRDVRPVDVVITRPTRRQPVFGAVQVAAEVNAEEPIDRVEFLLDGNLVAVVGEPPYEAVVDAGEGNADREFTARAYGAWGGRGNATLITRRVEFADRMEVALKQLYVTVTRSDGPITGLTRQDFQLWDNGVRERIVTFGGGDVAITAVLLLDASESMQGRYLQAALEGSRAFLGRMNDLDQAMVLLFSDRTLAATPFFSARHALLPRLGEGPGGGGTALNDHLYAGLRLLDGRQGRRVVILLSDGADVSSALRMDNILWKVRRSDATIYWIRLLGGESDQYSSSWRNAEDNRREQEQLKTAVEESGGRIVALADIAETGRAFDEIMSELRTQYVLGYYPTRPLADGGWRPVRVTLSGGAGKVRLRSGYVDF